MKVAIMQPYFFPFLGYFQLMSYVDHWIIFDSTQFINKGWVNRNRILHQDPKKQWQYITVPLKGKNRFDTINRITIDNELNWDQSIFGKLTIYRSSPNYKMTRDFLEPLISKNEDNLSDFLEYTIRETANYLGIKTKISKYSSLPLKIDSVEHPGQWALKISEHLNASTYINPINGEKLFNRNEFRNSGISLEFIEPRIRSYSQGNFFPTKNLSIIDALMWNTNHQLSDIIRNEFIIRDEGLHEKY